MSNLFVMDVSLGIILGILISFLINKNSCFFFRISKYYDITKSLKYYKNKVSVDNGMVTLPDYDYVFDYFFSFFEYDRSFLNKFGVDSTLTYINKNTHNLINDYYFIDRENTCFFEGFNYILSFGNLFANFHESFFDDKVTRSFGNYFDSI